MLNEVQTKTRGHTLLGIYKYTFSYLFKFVLLADDLCQNFTRLSCRSELCTPPINTFYVQNIKHWRTSSSRKLLPSLLQPFEFKSPGISTTVRSPLLIQTRQNDFLMIFGGWACYYIFLSPSPRDICRRIVRKLQSSTCLEIN